MVFFFKVGSNTEPAVVVVGSGIEDLGAVRLTHFIISIPYY